MVRPGEFINSPPPPMEAEASSSASSAQRQTARAAHEDELQEDQEDEYYTWKEIERETHITTSTLKKYVQRELIVDRLDITENPSRTAKNSFAAYVIYYMRTSPTQQGITALQNFVEDFNGWDATEFARLSQAILRELQNAVQEKGIQFLEGSEQKTIAQRLHQVANRECAIEEGVRPTYERRTHSSHEEKTYSPNQSQGSTSADRTPTVNTSASTPSRTLPREPLPAAPRPRDRHVSYAQDPNPQDTYLPVPPVQQQRPDTQYSNVPPPPGSVFQNAYNQQQRPYTIHGMQPTRTPYAREPVNQMPLAMPPMYQLPPTYEVYNEKLSPDKMVTFNKTWKKENNYSGKPYDILSDKARIFVDLCRRLEITEGQFSSLFPDILEGRAYQFYVQNIGPGQTWKFLYDRLDQHFNTTINHGQYWTDWTHMSFARAKQENLDKTLHEVLETMFDKLTLAQRALGPDYAGDVQLHTAVVRACRGQPELEPAMFSVKPTCEALFAELRAAVQIAIDRKHSQYIQSEENESHKSQGTYFTDRKYNSFKPRNTRTNNPGFRPKQRPRDSSLRNPSPRTYNRLKKTCFVCKKEGCWSSNHSRDDKMRARKTYIANYTEAHNAKPDLEEIHAYIVNHEGYSDHEGEDTSHDEEESTWENPEQAIQYLNSASYLHRATGEDIFNCDASTPASQFILDNQYSTKYQGELWDTGAATVSTVGKAQLEAYLRENPRTKVDWTPGKTSISFGGANSQGSIGTVRMENPVGTVTYHVLDSPTPFLLCLADADRMGAYFNNVLNVIVRKDGSTVPVVRKWGHPFFNVARDEAVSYFTEAELRRLHRRFGHPRTERLHRMLQEAGHDVNSAVLEEIQKVCHHCQTHGDAPRRFKFTIKDNMHFNYEIVIDVVRIGGKDVLHVIDSDTSFQAAVFLKSLSARDTWDALCKCWINTYQGPPDYIVHDPGTNFASEEFRNRAKVVGVECRQMPVEAHWAVGKVERAHAPLRRTYEILKAEIGYCTDDDSLLQMAVKALNDTAGPNGLVPTLLVFGSYPRINIDSPPSPDIIARANAIRKAMRMLAHERAKVNVGRATNTRNGPVTYDILKAPLGTKVLAWREKKGWMGPYEIKSIDGNDVTIELDNGPVKLRCTHVKIYHPPPPGEEEEEREGSRADEPLEDQPAPIVPPPTVRRRGRPRKNHDTLQPVRSTLSAKNTSPVQSIPTKRRVGRPRKARNPNQEYVSAFLTQKEKDDLALAVKLRADGVVTTPGNPFELSDRTEMESLMANGTFEVLKFDSSIHTGRIFNLRLVREIKGKTTQPYEKSRLVLAGHSDAEKEAILTQAPTIQRMSQRLILAIGATLIARHGMTCELRDITQAYVQAKDKIERTLLARPPKELCDFFPPETILRIVRPLYGAAESGLYWFKTYHAHHRDALRMHTSTYDPCLLVTDEGTSTFGITGMQTDDTLSFVTPSFSAREEDELQKATFRAKDKTTLSHEKAIEFNGGKIVFQGESIVLTQKGQASKLRTINSDDNDAAQQYVAQRARGAYISSVCQPEAAFDLSTAAQTTQPTKEDIGALNVRIQWQIDNPARGLNFIPLDLDCAKLFIFTDGSFANNKDMSSQLGFVIVLANEVCTGTGFHFQITGNIIHWNSTKCKRVTRSVLASELYGMVNGFDCAIALGTTLNQIARTLGTPPIPVVICTDSKSLYDCLVKLGTTNEKRLMIDIMSLRESYEKREISEIRWINGKDNPADACTKRTPNSALTNLVSYNKLDIKVEAFVERKDLVRES
jgi:hypothetical protein